MVVDFEHLFDGFWDDQPADDSLVTHERNAVSEYESCGCGTSLDRFSSVLDLEQSPIWAKGGDAVVISSSAWLHLISLICLVVSTLYEDEGECG